MQAANLAVDYEAVFAGEPEPAPPAAAVTAEEEEEEPVVTASEELQVQEVEA